MWNADITGCGKIGQQKVVSQEARLDENIQEVPGSDVAK